jgi:hypothetical protein
MAQMREYIDHLDHWHERREDIAYAMQSAEEFIAMLSNENVAKFLSMVQATGDMRVSDERRSLWESIIDQIVKLFKAAKGSLLESALTELIGFSLRDRGKKGVKYSLSEKIDKQRGRSRRSSLQLCRPYLWQGWILKFWRPDWISRWGCGMTGPFSWLSLT